MSDTTERPSAKDETPPTGLHGMSRADRDKILADAEARVRQAADEHIAGLRRPISFKGCGPWQRVVMAVVQHAATENTITVSHDGNINGAWRLPLRFTKPPKAGMPIVRILHTEAAFQAMPAELGFLLIEVPGWLASKQDLCQAYSPVLSAEIEWSDSQRGAWERLRKSFFLRRDSANRNVTKQRARAHYASGRTQRNADGRFTISDLSSGTSEL